MRIEPGPGRGCYSPLPAWRAATDFVSLSNLSECKPERPIRHAASSRVVHRAAHFRHCRRRHTRIPRLRDDSTRDCLLAHFGQVMGWQNNASVLCVNRKVPSVLQDFLSMGGEKEWGQSWPG